MKSLITCFLLLILFSAIQGWCDAELELNNRFERGARYLDAERYDLALTEFQSIRKEFATSEDVGSLAECYIGIVYQELNSLSEAVSAYQSALALKAPQGVHGTAHLHLGVVYKTQGELTHAENHLRQALALLPENAEGHIHLGDVYVLQHRLNAAENAYRESIRLNPDHTESYYGLGRVSELQNRLQQAMEYYDAALVRNQYLSQAHYRRALTYRRLGNSEQAAAAMAQFRHLKTYEDTVHEYREALYLNPNLPMLYIKLGELHEAYNNLTAAVQIYETATQVHPSYLPGYAHLGEVFIKQRAFEKAALAYQKSTEIAPDDPQTWLKLGVIYINQQQFEPAIAAFKRAIVVDSTAAEAYNNLARLYAGLGKEMQQAIDLAKHAVSLEPTARYYDTLAYTYYRNTQYAEALEAIHQALALAPEVDVYNKFLSKIQTAQAADRTERKNR
ncbi:tetratricopeptide repeat protein [Candidatus Poribacteria bacterium]|nr:tetratricopeptide repeat protein [Candidatus Poribacteria bacterium]